VTSATSSDLGLQFNAEPGAWRSGAELESPCRSWGGFYAKRALDVVLSAAAILVLIPIAVLIGVAIVLDSTGPVFFVQRRAGSKRHSAGGRTFWTLGDFPMLKFRTMYADCDQRIHEQRIEDFVNNQRSANGCFKPDRDPRITPVGRWLRKFSFDELPQLVNVLIGNMSLVGPRPVPLYEAAHYQQGQLERLCALPGITGLWQVSGRAESTFEEMIELDIRYVRTRSAWVDLKLLFKTIPVVLTGRGGY